MATANQSKESIASFLSGKLAQVDVRQIETELSRLWAQANASEDNVEHPQVIRACSGNLILYTDREDAENVDSNLLDEVILSHPSRAILAICRESENRKLEAWVTARCHLASGGGAKQICSEQITVLAEGQNLENELISVIESLVLGDLPVFLWWTAAHLSGDKLGPFLACSRRLVVDSARAPYSFSYLRDLCSVAESTEGCVAVSDLNWRRLLGMRAAISEEFEREPFNLSDLKKIKKVTISSCAQEFQNDDCSLQALFLTGWLASRLGWTPESFAKEKDRGTLARFKHGDEIVELEFKAAVMTHVSAGSIFEIEIETGDTKKLRVSRDPAGEAGTLFVTVSQTGKRIRELVADDSDLDRVHLMGYELEEMGADKIFLESLSSAVELLHLLEQR